MKALEMLSFENIFQRKSPVRVQIEPAEGDYTNSKTVLRSVLNAHMSILESGEIVTSDKTTNLETPPKQPYEFRTVIIGSTPRKVLDLSRNKNNSTLKVDKNESILNYST